MSSIPESDLHRIVAHLREGHFLHALKLYRERTGKSLVEAKGFLDELKASLEKSTLSEAVLLEILHLGRGGDLSQAVKLCLDRMGCTEAAASAFVSGLFQGRAGGQAGTNLDASLREAVRVADRQAVAELLANGANPNALPGRAEDPPLAFALEHGQPEIARLLLDYGAKPDCTSREGLAPLLIVLARGDLATAALLLSKGAAASASDPKHPARTALCLLVTGNRDDPGLIETLLRRGARAETEHLAQALLHGHLAMAEQLLAGGVEADGRDGTLTPLIMACQNASAQFVQRLVDRGCRLNAHGPTGETALHVSVASRIEPEAKIRFLMTRGANLFAADNDRRTPMALARFLGRHSLVELMEELSREVGPTWMREARARKIAKFQIYRDKDCGLSFNPNDIEAPILDGGDYDGQRPISAAAALVECRRDLARHPFPDQARAFHPFIERLARGEDFSLSELEGRCRVTVEYLREQGIET